LKVVVEFGTEVENPTCWCSEPHRSALVARARWQIMAVSIADLMALDSLDGVSILDGLSVHDLARVVQTNQEFQSFLMSGRRRLWHKAVTLALPGFNLEEDLLDRPCDFLPLLGRFLKATTVAGKDDSWEVKVTGRKPDVLRLGRMRDAQLLYDRLKNAHQTAIDHIDAGGTYVKVLLAQLAIPALSSKVRFPVDREREQDSDEEGFNPDLVFGRPIVVPASEAPQMPPEMAATPQRGRLGRRGPSQGDDQAPRPLSLHFARLQHQLLMAARDDDAPPAAIPPPHQHFDWTLRRPVPAGSGMKVVADISIADLTHQLFHFRGISINVNGPWVDCCGLYAPATGHDVFEPPRSSKDRLEDMQEREEGLLQEFGLTYEREQQAGAVCIICLRDDFSVERSAESGRGSRGGALGPGGVSETFGVAKLPDALHLDSLRTPSSWGMTQRQ